MTPLFVDALIQHNAFFTIDPANKIFWMIESNGTFFDFAVCSENHAMPITCITNS